MSPLFTLQEEYFGLDLGNSAIRLVELKAGTPRPSLVTYGSIDLPPGLAQSDSQVDLDNLAKLIHKLTDSAKVTTKNAVIAVPGVVSFAVTLKLPSMSEKELREAIKYQAEQNIPISLADVKYDWQVVRTSGPGQEMLVMVVASPKAKIDRLVSVVERAGFEVIAVETTPLAFSRALSFSSVAPLLIVNIGALATELAMVENETVALVRSLSIGGDAFTRAVAQNLNVDLVQAEQFKQKFGLSKEKLEGVIPKALKPLLDDVVEEIKRSIGFYQTQFQGGVPEKIILSGGAAKLEGLPAHLATVLKIPVVFGNTWGKIAYPKSEEGRLISVAADFSTAAGLALKNFIKK